MLSGRVARVYALPWLRALVLVHGGGLLVLALAALVESANDSPAVWMEHLVWQVPRAWALLAAPLSVVSSAVAVHRLREQGALFALSTLGLAPFGRVWAALAAGVGVGIVAQTTGILTLETSEILRGAGGWMVRGSWMADVEGGLPGPLRADTQWAGLALYVSAAALLGSGIRGLGQVLVGSAVVLVVDLVRRSTGAPAYGPAVVLLLAILWRAYVWPERTFT